ESSVIHATISDKLVGLDNDDKVVLPYYDENNTTLIRFTVGEVGKETEYVLSTELENVFIALDRLNITDIESFTGSVDLSILADDTKRGEVISSVIIQATISETIIDLDTNLTIVAPHFSESEILLRKIADNGPVSTEYISVSEIDKLIIAMNILNITDLDTFNGDIDLSILAVGNNGQRVLESSVIHATISDKLVGLDNADKVTLPYYAEDNLMQIRNTVGEVGKETEYVLSTELENIFVALNILNITDIESFTGSVDLSLLEDETNRTDVLSSVIIQATISETIIDLDTNLTIVAPHFSESEILLRKIADNGPVSTEFISVSEIDKLIIAMNILNITDLDTFNGDIDLSILAVGDNATDVIASDIIQATMSREVISLNDASTINAPYYQDDDTTLVRLSVGELQTETEYVKKLELEALVIALDILGITNIEDFTGSIDLSKFYSLENRNILLMSSIMQATISEQVINLGTSIIVVPTYNELGVETRRLVGTVGKTTDYILKQEIHDLFEALELFAITDINDFTGTITLDQFFESLDPEYDQNQQILLASASMHRTITKQISDLGNSVLAVPTYSITNTRVDFTVLATDYYIEKIEIKALFKALDILSINDITSFNGTVDLTPLFDIPANPNYSDNQDYLLASSLMHKTITNQIKNLGDTVLKVPEIGFDGVTTIDQVVQSNYYIEKFEIKFLIDALNILGISDITGFDGTIDLTRLSAETDQNRILYSASIHATISMNLFDLDDQVLIVPIYSSLGEVESYRVQKQVNSVDFIYQEEIKALINAFTDMGYSDLSSFGSEINSQKFFDNPNLYLLSASIHATLSDKLINGTGGELVVPDKDILNNTIRIIHSDVVYVEMNETKLLLTALEEIGLTNFSNIAISPTNLFDANTDISVLLASVSMQATISDTLLAGAGDDTTAYGTSTLIIPNYFRETIYVNLVATEQVEKTELEKLIIALKTVGVPDFTGSVPASEITNITDEDLDLKVLASGSMHVTINHMIWGNGNVNTLIPDEREGLALTDLLYNMNNIIIKDEVLAFIIAVKTTSSGSSITNVSFNYTTIASLSEPDRKTVLESLIVQNIMTDQLSVLWNADPFYEPAASDYHDSNTSYFLTDDGIRSVMIHYSII
ncbi:MAG: hypothetical protein WCY80_01910, partial [Candidatus Izemoplasmatales bacterium]